ncbi:melanopsin-like [Osmerus eperlanus]|uniref:melanopsin-like n=1 Tax=Osmerus eperlanus TaxID=29151 RepID=UPI002E11A94F
MSYHHSTRKGIFCHPGEPNCTEVFTDHQQHLSARTSKHLHLPFHEPTHGPHIEHPHLFPTVDVPDHAHYIIGSVILMVGITGVLGNALVIYVFCRSRTLRTPSNLFVVNLAIADFLMSLTQSPVFFVASLHRRWVFGERACELYAFCGGLFGICSMMTLTAIAADRCMAITQPLASLGGMSRKRAVLVLVAVWLYSLGWSLPPFFGWSAYVPEGLQTSCSWDYMTFTAPVRAYTILLFTFVFFIPLGVIGGCYFAIFRAIRRIGREVQGMDCGDKAYERLRSEWRMAKVALGVILLFVVSWSPYSVVALTATAGYAHLLTPYMNSVPAVIAKASAIHNPIIYAITHPKYRAAIGLYVPLLRSFLRVREKELRSSFSSSNASSRRPTLTSQCSLGVGMGVGACVNGRWGKSRLSSVSDTESCWTESEADGSSVSSLPFIRRVSTEISADTAIHNQQQSGLAGQKEVSDSLRVSYIASPPSVFDGDSLDVGNLSDGKALLLSTN